MYSLQAKNILGALNKMDWAPFIDREGPLAWPEFEPAPEKPSGSKSNSGMF